MIGTGQLAQPGLEHGWLNLPDQVGTADDAVLSGEEPCARGLAAVPM
jgi:hypothetical protein